MNHDDNNEKKHYRIRSFSQRGSRLGRKYEEMLENVGAHYLVEVERGDSPSSLAPQARVDIDDIFQRHAPLVVEIGPGSGEQTVSWAREHPDYNILAIEAWHPGAARCVARAHANGVTNVRILEADAAQALPILFGLRSAGIDDAKRVADLGAEVDPEHPNAVNVRAREIWTFFPDPWRKKRHFKRRLVNETFAGIVAGCLADDGVWRLGTDWDTYAWQMRNVVEDSPYFINPYRTERPDPRDDEPERGGFAPRWDGRVLTRFEQRGIEAGRTVHDVCGLRVSRA